MSPRGLCAIYVYMYIKWMSVGGRCASSVLVLVLYLCLEYAQRRRIIIMIIIFRVRGPSGFVYWVHGVCLCIVQLTRDQYAGGTSAKNGFYSSWL